MTPPERILAEIAVGMALCHSSESSPPRPWDRPLPFSGVTVGAFVVDVSFLVIDAPMVVNLSEEPVPAKVVGINLASGLYVPNRRTDKRSLGHVRLQFKPTPESIPLYP